NQGSRNNDREVLSPALPQPQPHTFCQQQGCIDRRSRADGFKRTGGDQTQLDEQMLEKPFVSIPSQKSYPLCKPCYAGGVHELECPNRDGQEHNTTHDLKDCNHEQTHGPRSWHHYWRCFRYSNAFQHASVHTYASTHQQPNRHTRLLVFDVSNSLYANLTRSVA